MCRDCCFLLLTHNATCNFVEPNIPVTFVLIPLPALIPIKESSRPTCRDFCREAKGCNTQLYLLLSELG